MRGKTQWKLIESANVKTTIVTDHVDTFQDFDWWVTSAVQTNMNTEKHRALGFPFSLRKFVMRWVYMTDVTMTVACLRSANVVSD